MTSSPPTDARSLVAQLLSAGSLDVRGATILGTLDLARLDVRGLVAFEDCTIDAFTARNAKFGRSLTLRRCRIAGTLDLVGANVAELLELTGTDVRGAVSLVNCRVGSGLPAAGFRAGAAFDAAELSVVATADFSDAVFDGPLTFADGKIDKSLSLAGARCSGDVSLSGARIGKVDASKATFATPALFKGLTVASDAYFADARFESDAIFTSASVADQLFLDGATFAGEAIFTKVKCNDLLARKSTFVGDVTLEDIATALVCNLAGSTFASAVVVDGGRTGDLNFRGATCSGPLRVENLTMDARLVLSGATFAADVSLANVGVTRSALCDGTQFHATFSCSAVAVGGRFSFKPSESAARPVLLARSLNFDGVTIGRDLQLCGIDTGAELHLSGTRIGGDLDLSSSRFAAIDLAGAQIGCRLLARDLTTRTLGLSNVSVDEDVELTGTVDETARFDGTSVGGSLTVRESTIATFSGSFLTIKREFRVANSAIGTVDLEGATISGITDLCGLRHGTACVKLRDGAFGAILVATAMTLDAPERERLAGVTFDLADSTYAFIRCDPAVLAATFRDPSNRQPYLMLESMLRKRGFENEADEIYVLGRKAVAAKLGPFSRLFDGLIFALTGYGVSLERSLTALAIAIVLGASYFAVAHGATVNAADERPATKTTAAVSKFDCPTTRTPGPVDSAYLAFKAVVPTSFPDAAVNVVDSCPVTIAGVRVPAALTMVATIVLKLVGLILIPVVLGMLAGLFRPAARA